MEIDWVRVVLFFVGCWIGAQFAHARWRSAGKPGGGGMVGLGSKAYAVRELNIAKEVP